MPNTVHYRNFSAKMRVVIVFLMPMETNLVRQSNIVGFEYLNADIKSGRTEQQIWSNSNIDSQRWVAESLLPHRSFHLIFLYCCSRWKSLIIRWWYCWTFWACGGSTSFNAAAFCALAAADISITSDSDYIWWMFNPASKLMAKTALHENRKLLCAIFALMASKIKLNAYK